MEQIKQKLLKTRSLDASDVKALLKGLKASKKEDREEAIECVKLVFDILFKRK